MLGNFNLENHLTGPFMSGTPLFTGANAQQKEEMFWDFLKQELLNQYSEETHADFRGEGAAEFQPNYEQAREAYRIVRKGFDFR